MHEHNFLTCMWFSTSKSLIFLFKIYIYYINTPVFTIMNMCQFLYYCWETLIYLVLVQQDIASTSISLDISLIQVFCRHLLLKLFITVVAAELRSEPRHLLWTVARVYCLWFLTGHSPTSVEYLNETPLATWKEVTCLLNCWRGWMKTLFYFEFR